MIQTAEHTTAAITMLRQLSNVYCKQDRKSHEKQLFGSPLSWSITSRRPKQRNHFHIQNSLISFEIIKQCLLYERNQKQKNKRWKNSKLTNELDVSKHLLLGQKVLLILLFCERAIFLVERWNQEHSMGNEPNNAHCYMGPPFTHKVKRGTYNDKCKWNVDQFIHPHWRYNQKTKVPCHITLLNDAQIICNCPRCIIPFKVKFHVSGAAMTEIRNTENKNAQCCMNHSKVR